MSRLQRYSLRARVGWAVLALVVLAGVYQIVGLLWPVLPGPPAPRVTTPRPAATLPSAGPTPDAPSPAPGRSPPTVVVVQPQRGDRGPAGEPGAVIVVRPSEASPSPSRSPSARPSPSPTCTVTVAGLCLPPSSP